MLRQMRVRPLQAPAFVLTMNAQGLCVARSLGRRGIPVVGFDDEPRRIGFVSRYCRAVRLPDLDTQPERWVEALVSEARRWPTPGVLIPCNDKSVLLVSKFRQALTSVLRARLPSDGLAELFLDKRRTYERAAAMGLAVPRHLVAEDAESLSRVAREVGFPCAIKPVHSHRWQQVVQTAKLIPVASPQALQAQWAQLVRHNLELLVTELIPGDDTQLYGLYTYLDRQGHPLFAYTKRKLRQYPAHFGIGSLHESAAAPEVTALGLSFLQGLGYRGFAHVEFKWDPRDGRFKLIEVNPRCTVAMALVVASGIDAPYLAYREILGETVPPHSPRTARKKLLFLEQDYEAFRAYRRQGLLSWGAWLRSLWGTNVFGIFAWDDPWPFVRSIARRIRGAIVSRVSL